MIVVDVESTGVGSSFYSVPCEVAMVYADGDQIKDSYNALISPPENFETYFYDGLKKSSVFHKITKTMIENEAKPIKVVAKEVFDFISKYHNKDTSYIYAWNYNSDKIFLLKLFMFAEFDGGINFISNLAWKEMMPKFKTGLDRYMKEDIYDYASSLLVDHLELKRLWKSQHRHRAFFDTVMQYAIMLKYSIKPIELL